MDYDLSIVNMKLQEGYIHVELSNGQTFQQLFLGDQEEYDLLRQIMF